MNIFGSLQLLAKVWRHVAETDAPVHFSMIAFRSFGAVVVAATHSFKRDGKGRVLAIANHLQLDGRARSFLSNFYLKLASVGHFLSIEFSDHVADFQSSLGCG